MVAEIGKSIFLQENSKQMDKKDKSTTKTLCSIFRKKWIIIDEFHYHKVELKPINNHFIKNPFQRLPVKILLTENETNRLQNLTSKKQWVGEEFLIMQRLKLKRGMTQSNFLSFQEELQQLISDCIKCNIELPPSFVTFFSTYDYLSRFRFGDISFFLFYSLVPFPENKSCYLVPFLGDSQGFGWWSLLMHQNGEYCVVYRDLHWLEYPTGTEPAEYGEYFFCANSFEEFLVRISEDTVEKEKKKLYLWSDKEEYLKQLFFKF